MAANNDETWSVEDAQLHKAYSTRSHNAQPQVYPVAERMAAKLSGRTVRSFDEYKTMYKRSLDHNSEFWKEQAHKTLDWIRPFDQVMSGGFKQGDVAWFLNGQLNACYNCVDRHVPTKGDQTAIIWEGDAPSTVKKITYNELLQEVSRFANLLKSLGVRKGDRVAIYMPMVPQAAYAMLACARIGAVHNVVFAGFSAEALRDRINNAAVEVVITADEGMRGGRAIPLKKVVDEAIAQCPTVKKVVVQRHTGGKVHWVQGRDIWLHEHIELQRPYCPPEPMNAEDLLFLLYTSGSTGAPKGLAHTTAGYLLYASLTHRHVFDYQDGDVYACVADIGWITGHSYILYGPLLNGATTVMFESVPTFPDAGRYWDLVARHKINLFYTAPTAIRTLMSFGDSHVKKHDRSSLRVLGSVGEPINPEAWRWYNDVVGDGKCAVVDTYWQTETGGIVVTPLPGATPTKPGSATLPFFGVDTAVLDPQTGKELTNNDVSGVLAIRRPWPGMARTVYGDHSRYVKTYFSQYPGFYFTGDGCVRDKDGYIWITGRVDDVINKAGHRIGTAEVESALVGHSACAEAAVIGIDDKVKGQAIFAYVSVIKDIEIDENQVINNLKQEVRKRIGGLAVPDYIVITPYLPKTRSGKIMRRVLRKIASGESDQLGDTSTLADPDSLQGLIKKVDVVLKDHQR